MTTHSNDGEGTTDPRLAKVPAQYFEEGAMRPIWASPESYPRYVGYDRGARLYFPENCQAGSKNCDIFEPIGYIPQVNHTFAYFENTYGTMNERQVALSESTCSSVFVARSVASGGHALLSIDQLSQIAMERATTAKEAIELMGALSEEFGFYGPSASFEGGAESLLISDPNEAWVFHILADPSGASAIWAAARVPDDSVAVVANMFSIREMDMDDTSNFLGRADMWEIAAAEGLWEEGTAKGFTMTFSDGEYSHKYYSGRRMWGVFHLLAPSAELPSVYGNLKYDKPYPFAVPVDAPVTPQDIMKVMRYWYEDTEYSTSTGIAAGAFGTPDRFNGNADDAKVEGSWERTIALFRTSDSSIVQSRSWLPDEVGGIVWFGSGAAHSTVYVPMMVGMLDSPDNLQYGWQGVYNLSTSYWAHRNILNTAQIKFDFMIEDIREVQNRLESDSQLLVDEISNTFLTGNNNNNKNNSSSSRSHTGPSSSRSRDVSQVSTSDMALVTALLTENSVAAVDAYTLLLHTLLFTYADGWINFWLPNAGFESVPAGYPVWWLEDVGYENGPEPIPVIGTSPSQQVLQRAKAEKESHAAKLRQQLDEVIRTQRNHTPQRATTTLTHMGITSSSSSSSKIGVDEVNTVDAAEHLGLWKVPNLSASVPTLTSTGSSATTEATAPFDSELPKEPQKQQQQQQRNSEQHSLTSLKLCISGCEDEATHGALKGSAAGNRTPYRTCVETCIAQH